MEIIVDYNNVDRQLRRHGVRHVAECISACFIKHTTPPDRRLNLRLYDGWYQRHTLTKLAQQIASEIQRDFPTTISTPDRRGVVTKISISAEMAYSLHCDPTSHIWHTYRPRSGLSNISCTQPVLAGCTVHPCPFGVLPSLLLSRRCPDSSCTLTTEDLIIRDEQKLIDSMMSIDLIALHMISPEGLIVVSSDDDLWPALRYLLYRGHTIYHIHTKPYHTTSRYYSSRKFGKQYIQLYL